MRAARRSSVCPSIFLMATRPALGSRSVSSSSSGLHHYFLRSTTSGSSDAGAGGQWSSESSVQSSPSSVDGRLRAASPTLPGRTLKKKKSSIWSMFSRGSRKASAPSVLQQDNQQQEHGLRQDLGMTLSNMSNMSIDIPAAGSSSSSTASLQCPPRLSSRLPSGECSGGGGYGGTSLRSQRSMNTIGSTSTVATARTLRSAKSHFTLRLPAGVAHFDTDSIFSDDSEGGVSWITSTGRRKVGLDFEDDDDMMDLRR